MKIKEVIIRHSANYARSQGFGKHPEMFRPLLAHEVLTVWRNSFRKTAFSGRKSLIALIFIKAINYIIKLAKEDEFYYKQML